MLAAAQRERIEKGLFRAVRELNERESLCREMADLHASHENVEAHEAWAAAARECQERLAQLQVLTDADWLHPEESRGRELAG